MKVPANFKHLLELRSASEEIIWITAWNNLKFA